MQYGANDRHTPSQVIVWSTRQLLVDCVSHHLTSNFPPFRVVSKSARGLDGSVPTVCIRDVGRRSFSSAEKRGAVDEIWEAAPGSRILVFSSEITEQDAADWILAGAHGVFSTLSTPDLLTAAVSLVAVGGLYLPEDFLRSLLDSSTNRYGDG